MNKVNIRIEFVKGTRIEQIEQSCIFLYAIFGVFFEPDEIGALEGERLKSQVDSFSQLGIAFTNLINENISHFIEPDEDKENK